MPRVGLLANASESLRINKIQNASSLDLNRDSFSVQFPSGHVFSIAGSSEWIQLCKGVKRPAEGGQAHPGTYLLRSVESLGQDQSSMLLSWCGLKANQGRLTSDSR
jgi:hypothetical protein